MIRDGRFDRLSIPIAVFILMIVAAGSVSFEAAASIFPAKAGYVSFLGIEASLESLYHVTLHSISLGLSSLLLAISLAAFFRDRRSRFLWLTGAFGGMVVRELADLGRALLFSAELILPGTGIELEHLLDLVIISLFSFSVLRGTTQSNLARE